MSVLEDIFEGYYENRIGGEKADPEEMKETQKKISERVLKKMEYTEACETMEDISEFGMYAERIGFIAGFEMAWNLIKEMER